MSESSTTLSLTATLATPTMTPMGPPTPTPPLQLTQYVVFFLCLFVIVYAVITIGIPYCCLCAQWIRKRRRIPGASHMNVHYDRVNLGLVRYEEDPPHISDPSCSSTFNAAVRMNAERDRVNLGLDRYEVDPQDIPAMRPWNKEALKSMREELGGVEMDMSMIKQLEKSDVPDLDNMGFLSQMQLQEVEFEKTPAGQMNKVIDYLLEMDDKYFEYFCTILEQINFEGKAKRLREKAEELKTIAYENELRRLCLIHCGIDQLTIHPSGGNFRLGSGDATLTVHEDTVEKETVVRYAVILHGPFVYSAGYKPASVVVYLNLEGSTLLKPIKLILKHWCKPVEVSGEAVLRLLRAPHTTGEMDKMPDCYIFHEVQGTSSSNSSTFTISEPQCLYGVEMENESQASYNAIAFQKNLPDENLVKFRIQFMCDSLEWNTYLKLILEQRSWKINSHEDGGVPKFSFADRQITATPHELHGPGWQAAIDGHQSIRERDLLEILGKDTDEVIAEVRNGRYPPCILYQVLYTSVAERRRAPAFWRAELQGADVKLFFSCKVLQELVPPDEVSLTTEEHDATASIGSHGRRKARPRSDSSHPMSTWNDAALVSLKDSLKRNLSMSSGLSDKLEKAAGGFCSRDEAQEIRGLSSNREQIDRVIAILRGKANEDFQTFCTMLRETNNVVWADELERKAAWHKQQGGEDVEGPSVPPAKKAKGLKHAKREKLKLA